MLLRRRRAPAGGPDCSPAGGGHGREALHRPLPGRPASRSWSCPGRLLPPSRPVALPPADMPPPCALRGRGAGRSPSAPAAVATGWEPSPRACPRRSPSSSRSRRASQPLADGTLVLAEAAANRIVRVTPAGVVTALATGMTNPYGIAVAPSGDVYATTSDTLVPHRRSGRVTPLFTIPDLGPVDRRARRRRLRVATSTDVFASTRRPGRPCTSPAPVRPRRRRRRRPRRRRADQPSARTARRSRRRPARSPTRTTTASAASTRSRT